MPLAQETAEVDEDVISNCTSVSDDVDGALLLPLRVEVKGNNSLDHVTPIAMASTVLPSTSGWIELAADVL